LPFRRLRVAESSFATFFSLLSFGEIPLQSVSQLNQACLKRSPSGKNLGREHDDYLQEQLI